MYGCSYRKEDEMSEEQDRMRCWFCGDQMIWGADFDYEDYGMEGDGIVATFSCPNCGATADCYSGSQEDRE